MSVINPFDFFPEPYATTFPFKYEAWQQEELEPYLHRLPLTPLLRSFLETVPSEPRASVDFLVDLNRQVQRAVGYVIRLEPGVQTPEETLELARGSCRDSAWLLVQVLRHLGLAARFVSGYLIQLVPDVKSLDGPSGTDHDFTDLHAWCEVYLPGAGWIGLDPTSGLFAGEGHIPLACSPQPSSAAPITGFTEACECEFEHHMKVERVWEAPRVTKPYSDAQWSAIESARPSDRCRSGQQHDVRLTMGGEPTFRLDRRPRRRRMEHRRARADQTPSAPRKSFTACVRATRRRACSISVRASGIRANSLPRWSLNCFWRRDGQPVWNNPALYADETRDYGADESSRRALPGALAERLAVDPKHVFPAFEDVYYYLWREHRCRSTSIPSTPASTTRLNATAWRRFFVRGSTRWSAMSCRSSAAAGRLAERPWFLRARSLLSGAGRFTDRLPPAARLAALGGQIRLSLHPCSRSDADAFHRCAACRDQAQLCGQPQREPGAEPAAVTGDHFSEQALDRCRASRGASCRSDRAGSVSNRPRGSRAPPCRRRPATACCISSCRRPRRSTTTSNW
jgi:hypothetical protein